MLHDFDPMVVRRWYRDRLFSSLEKDDVLQVAPTARTHFSTLLVGRLVEANLVGLGESVRGALRRQLAGMQSVPEPDRAQFHKGARGEEIWCERLYEWRQLLGVCKWLAGEPAGRELTAALAADWQGLQSVPASDVTESRIERCHDLSIRLATALAADAPRFGLDMLDFCRATKHDRLAVPMLGFGVWACHHLAAGGQRDDAFLSRGKRALSAALLSVLLPNARMIEIALWIKAILFDSGVAKTAEEAMMLAYECMPGVHPPDFE